MAVLHVTLNNMKKDLKYKHWMITVLSNKDGSLELPSNDIMTIAFNREGEKWLYQEEKHENSEGKTHYQCCLETTIRKRQQTLLNNLAESLDHPIERIRVDRMLGSWDQAIAYCSKSESSIEGSLRSNKIPFQYDKGDIEFLKDPGRRYPWQNSILDKIFEAVPMAIKNADDRKIYWVTDEHGNTGKSKLLKYLCAYNSSIAKLPFGSAQQLRSAIITIGQQDMYVVDCPRTLGTDDSIRDIASVIEDLKNGFVVSSFYGNYAKLVMPPPQVLVFSNMRCPTASLSADRWECYIINNNKELKYSLDNPDYVEKGYSMTYEGEIDNRNIQDDNCVQES